jgi:glycosyltransferase involved in cell wall biosynthesis
MHLRAKISFIYTSCGIQPMKTMQCFSVYWYFYGLHTGMPGLGMSLPFVSVVVPGYNASETLEATLSSIRNQDWPEESLEVIYVDDASTDSSAGIASKWANRIVRLTGDPKGPAEARNAGVREAKGTILIFFDSDIAAPRGTVRALVGTLQEDENLDAVFGSYDSSPSDMMFVSQYRNLLHHFVHQTSRHIANTFWAGCGAVRKNSFQKAGGFDANRYRGAMIEDIELGHRMCALGMQIRLNPSIQVKHLKKWAFWQMLRADVFSRGIPWMRLLFQNGSNSKGIGDLNLKLSGIASVVLAWIAVFLLLLSPWSLKLLDGVLLSYAILFVLNFSIYRFFWKARGLSFTLIVLPLHFLYHLYNGVSVLIATLYKWLIDKPLPGLKTFGVRLRAGYWHWYRKSRLARRKKRMAKKNPDSKIHHIAIHRT